MLGRAPLAAVGEGAREGGGRRVTLERGGRMEGWRWVERHGVERCEAEAGLSNQKLDGSKCIFFP